MKILEDFNIVTNNIELYETAFTHSSYANEHKLSDDYERLEFLGDTVLDLIMSEYLYKEKKLEEGIMTKQRANYVCEQALYQYALDLNLQDYLKLGKGEDTSGGKYKKAILADVFEAFIGAIYLDQGIDKAREFINKTVIPFIKVNEGFFIDYKSLLQEAVQPTTKSMEYELIEETGPSHDKVFTVAIKINNIVYGIGRASTKKEAEQLAAYNALLKRAEIEK